MQGRVLTEDAEVVAPARQERGTWNPARWGTGILRFARRKPLGAVGALMIALLTFAAVAAPLITMYEPQAINTREAFQGPSFSHWFGTDQYGRDLYTRVVYGARVAMLIGLIATVFAIVVGTVMGLLAGYVGTWIDSVFMRFVDALQAFPGIILAMAVAGVLGPGLDKVFFPVAITLIARPARVVRGSVLAAKETPWVEAARATGASPQRIMFRHILPNVFAPIIIIASLIFGIAILVEASLSFLGLGVQPPTAAWGSMLSATGSQYFETYPHMALAPGIAISATIFAFSLFGDALRDVLDPRLRGSR